MTALIIRGGTVVNHDHSVRADVLIDGDTIAAIGAAIDAPAGAQTIDAGGRCRNCSRSGNPVRHP